MYISEKERKMVLNVLISIDAFTNNKNAKWKMLNCKWWN